MYSIKNKRIKYLLEEFKENIIYLYGAGKRGKVAFDNLCALGFEKNIGGFLDDNCDFRNEYCGKPVYTIKQLHDFKKKNDVYIITTYTVNVMVCNLMQEGISSQNIHFFSELLIDEVSFEIFGKNREKIEYVYEMLDDYLSKFIYKSIYDIYLKGNIGILSRTKGDVQYFPMLVNCDMIADFYLTETESFIDCGAFDGDTIRRFKSKVNDKYTKIWGFEPDLNNFEKLAKYIEKEQDQRIQIFKAGVFDRDTSMSFDSNRGTSSVLSKDGKDSIVVYKLDNVINEEVTFIKMDIEGAEKAALIGAKNLLLKYKPKLAICIYHKIEDLWEIPILIKSINPEYRIYIRNYEDRIDETICYAI